MFYLIEQQIGVRRIGPIGLGSVLFQDIRLGPELGHQGHNDAVAVVSGSFLISRDTGQSA